MNMRIFAAALLLLAAASFSPIAEAQNATIPLTFRVFGQVTKPTTFDLAKLEKLSITSQNVTRVSSIHGRFALGSPAIRWRHYR
jgi:hypothetical protein